MSLLVNFVNSQLGCTIQSDAPSFSDEYALSNLVAAESPAIQSKGYLAAQFIKTPIDITISLPYSIEIERIGILPKTGSCTTQSLSIYVSELSLDEIQATTNRVMDTQIRSRNVPMLDAETPMVSRSRTLSVGHSTDLSKERYPGDLMLGGGMVYNQNGSSNNSVVYSKLIHRNFKLVSTMEGLQSLGSLYTYTCNSHFDYRQAKEHSSFYSLPPLLNDQIKQPNQLKSFHSNVNLLNNVKSIRIRILNVFQSTCAAIGGIEIWGLPSRSLSNDNVNQLYQRYQQTSFIQHQYRQQHIQPPSFSFGNVLNNQSSFNQPSNQSNNQLKNNICISLPLPNNQQQPHQQQPFNNNLFSIPSLPIKKNINESFVLPQQQQQPQTLYRTSQSLPSTPTSSTTPLSFSIGNTTNHHNHHGHGSHHHNSHGHHSNHSNHNTPGNTPRNSRSSMELDDAGVPSEFEQFLQNHPEIQLDEAGVPSIFIDPITAKIMEDPVVLPSGKIVDRTTVEQILQNQYCTDPFSRAPITYADIKFDHVLKSQIQSFVNEKKKRKRLNKKVMPTITSSSSSLPHDSSSLASSSSSIDSSCFASSSGSSFLVNSNGFDQLNLQLFQQQQQQHQQNDQNFLNDGGGSGSSMMDSTPGTSISSTSGDRRSGGSMYPLARLLSQTSLAELPIKKIKK